MTRRDSYGDDLPLDARESVTEAIFYMKQAVYSINEFFGDDYAEKNPVLVAAFMQTAAMNTSTSVQGRIADTSQSDYLPGAIENVGKILEDGINRIVNVLLDIAYPDEDSDLPGMLAKKDK